MSHDLAQEVNSAAMRISPAVAVASASVSGWGVQEWMYAATLIYVVMQALYLVWKWHREWKGRRK